MQRQPQKLNGMNSFATGVPPSVLMTTKLKPEAWFAGQAHYGVFNVTVRDKRKMLDYIAQQKQRHADNALLGEVEETYAEYDTDDTNNPAEPAEVA